MLKDRSGLLQGYSGKPFQKFRNLSTVFEILEKCRYRNPGPSKYPRAAYPVGVALNC